MSGPKSANWYAQERESASSAEAIRQIRLEEESENRDKLQGQLLSSLNEQNTVYIKELHAKEQADRQTRLLQAKKQEEVYKQQQTDMQASFKEGEILSSVDVLNPYEKKIQENMPKTEAIVEIDASFEKLKIYRQEIQEVLLSYVKKSGKISQNIQEKLNELSQAFTLGTMTKVANEIHSELALELTQIRAEQSQAREYLSQISSIDEGKSVLHQALKEIIDGKLRLSSTIVKSVQEILSSTKENSQRDVALILKTSLEEMGYDVDSISDTLFVEGGVTHFRDSTWDENYYVEMAVKPSDQSMTFRVVYEGEGFRTLDEDYKIEENWCSSFGALQRDTDSRGLSIRIKSHFQSGEVPVRKIAHGKIGKKLSVKVQERRKKKKLKESKVES